MRVLMAVLGTAGGAAVGLVVLLAIIVAKARAGYYTYSLDDMVALRWETLPVPIGAVAGGIFGFLHPRTLDRAALRGFAALLVGIPLGIAFGQIVWGSVEGRFAGGIMLGALGLLAGGLSAVRTPTPEPYPLLSGVAGAIALSSLGVLGAIGIVGTSERPPLAFEPVEDAPVPDPDGVDAVVFLLGDAGDAERERSPLLRALYADVERWSVALGRDSATSVVFLGDNVYPEGIHDRDHPEFPRDSARLWSQIALVSGPGARAHATLGLFLTGNHDWGNTHGPVGLQRVRNLEAQLNAARSAGHFVALLPPAGTPGPVVRDLRDNVRILFVDIHWFLQERSPERHGQFLDDLRAALDGAGEREVIMVAHHPFRSAGPHGALITDYHSGGIEYLLKRSGTLVQDLNSPAYRGLLGRMRQIFAEANRPPLVFAGGHDHSLQVLEGVAESDPRFILVSGAGSKISGVRDVPSLAWAGSVPGYMMLAFREDGGVDLFVTAGDRDYLECTGSGDVVAECMHAGVGSFDVVYSARLLGPAGTERDIPFAPADTIRGTPWFGEPDTSAAARPDDRR